MDKKDSFIIEGLNGEKTLKGEISIGGAKNAILPLMASAVLFEDEVAFSNVPEIDDVERMSELLIDLGIKIETKSPKIKISANKIKSTELDYEISKRLRASVILTGPILARMGKISFPHPGGCVIGPRPIDVFLEGFKKMGAEISEKEKLYEIEALSGKLVGTKIFFKLQSVTATETFMMAGVLAKGKTVLENCAIEPEVTCLAEFLISCGAKIKGVGTTTLEIEGGELLKADGKVFENIPDRIEAGSFLILGALSADNLLIKDCKPSDLAIVIEILRDSGVPIETGKDFIQIKNNGKISNEKFKSFDLRTHEYPGFPTDLQAPMAVFLTQTTGEGIVFETIFEGRLNYAEDLKRMGADIAVWNPQKMLVKGPTSLRGKDLEGPDLRAGLAFIISATVAEGQSTIRNVHYIDRGYGQIEKRLKEIGLNIKRVQN